MPFSFTKIIATLGPATESEEGIRSLAKAGANLFRLNFSHGTAAQKKQTMDCIRNVEKELKTPIGVICDLQGPKLRVGSFKNGSVMLKNKADFRLDMKTELGDEGRVQLPHPEIFAALKEKSFVLLNDGQIKLQVKKIGKDYMDTVVVEGGKLSDHKGVNVPGVVLPIKALTEKDLKDLKSALSMGTDWVALSFVQRVEDVLEVKNIINGKAGLISKIEKPAALEHLEAIVDASDAVMVARGDLGVEMPIEHVPGLQKEIIRVCRAKGRPVIVATQMLESMIQNSTPTRAEVSDVATAVYDGADCVMLSAETAVGCYPVCAVSIMHKTVSKTEKDPFFKRMMSEMNVAPDHELATAITSAIVPMTKVLKKSACIVSYSMSGSTTLRVARERALLPILNLTQSERIMRRMTLVWGVCSALTSGLKTLHEVSPIAMKEAIAHGFAKKGDDLIVTAGIPFALKGNTNIIHVLTVK